MKQKFMFLLTCLLVFSYLSGNSQNVFFFSAHGNFKYPISKEFNNSYQNGIGFNFSAGVTALFPGTFIVGSYGNTKFAESADWKAIDRTGDLTMQTIQFGFRQKLFVKKLFAVVNAGTGFSKNTKGGKLSEQRFLFDAGIGTKFGIFETLLSYEFLDKKGYRVGGNFVTLKTGISLGW